MINYMSNATNNGFSITGNINKPDHCLDSKQVLIIFTNRKYIICDCIGYKDLVKVFFAYSSTQVIRRKQSTTLLLYYKI